MGLMEFDAATLDHLAGRTFSNGYRFEFAATPSRDANDRIGWLERWVEGKRVVHVGCCDHTPLILDKHAKGVWLHGRLCESAAHCIGIDIDPRAVDLVVRQMGYRDVHVADLLEDDVPQIEHQHWDCMILGEILEHMDNPVDFLTRLSKRYAGKVDEIVITVPNGLRYKNFINALRYRERINSDHRYWFTPYTLAKVVSQAGLRPRGFLFTLSSQVKVDSVRSWLRKVVLRRFPALRQTLVMVAQI